MDRARLRSRDPDLTGLSVLVVGAGRSGLAAAALAAERGAKVTLCDRQPLERIADAARQAGRSGVRVHAGGHPPRLAEEADLVVVSPGVPKEIDLLQRAAELDLPVWGEVELAARYCRGRIVGVTGSNGKSTVTTMVGAILRGAGVPGGTGGNLDRPLALLLEEDGPEAWHALELSSFQLDTVETLSVEVAVVLNLSPDHLDRHASMDDYARAKARLLDLQRTDAAAVLNADDAASARFRDAVRGRLHLFSTSREVDRGAFLRNDELWLRTEHGEERLLGRDELPLPGRHNVANALAAAVACRLAGCSPASITAGLAAYRALPHRLEPAGEIAGVRFYDDSKATNPAAAACALEAFAAGSIHLVLGGRDKGADWSDLVARIASRACHVWLVGEAAPVLERLLAGEVATSVVETVPRAVREAFRAARPGQVVLLAPGCASFDQYRNFAERGEDFRSAVVALGGRDG